MRVVEEGTDLDAVEVAIRGSDPNIFVAGHVDGAIDARSPVGLYRGEASRKGNFGKNVNAWRRDAGDAVK